MNNKNTTSENTIKTFKQGLTIGEFNAGLADLLSDGPFSASPYSYWDEEETCLTVPLHLDLTLVSVHRSVDGKFSDFRVKYQFLDCRVPRLLDVIWGYLPESDPGFSPFEDGLKRIQDEANIAAEAVKQWVLERGAPQVEVTYSGYDRASLRKIYELYENNQIQGFLFENPEDVSTVIQTKNYHTKRVNLILV